MENWKNLIHLLLSVFLYYFAMLLGNTAITDVTMEAICPGQDECSLSIYLTGLQQSVVGVGSTILMPLIGNLSDNYGRKPLLTIPMMLSILPLLILAWKRTMQFFYAYYIVVTLTAMFCDCGVMCISLGYLADNVSEGRRVSAFGVLSGVVAAATVCSTLGARLLPTAHIYQVAAVASIVAALYMRIFLKDTTRHIDDAALNLEQPILKPDLETTLPGSRSPDQTDAVGKIPLPKDIIRLLKSSVTISLASFVTFFNSLAETGSSNFLMYYLKARFHFQKDQFAEISLISNIGATISNMVLMPTLGPILGEEILLCIGLFAGFLQMLLHSIAWSSWVPYASSTLSVFLYLATPSIRCIISKQVGPSEQGIAQGCIMGVTSFANVVSPLIFSPLSALFLSKAAPFKFPGFSILCIGLAWLVGFIFSTMIKVRPLLCRGRPSDDNTTLS